MGLPAYMLETHPCRQAMHGIVSSSRPSAYLRGISGSAKLWRPNATRSHFPCPIKSSGKYGSVKRPTEITGMLMHSLIFATKSALNPACTEVGAHMNSSRK